MQITLTEGLIGVLVAAAASVLGAWFAARAAYRKAETEHESTEAQARQALRDDMMQYVEELRGEIKTLREENATLRARVREVEGENASLKAELARICGDRDARTGRR